MHARLALAGICLLALGSSCRSGKTQEEEAPSVPVITENSTLSAEQGGDAEKAAEPKKKNKFELYPPIFTIYPLSQPEPGHAFQFGYVPDAERPFQTVFGYVVAVEPDFQYGEAPPPVLLDPVAYE
jgi:hypothetical protein